MKFALKLIAASLTLAAAGQVNAAIADYTSTGSTGSSEMFLAVWDSVAETSYIRDLGIRMNDFMPVLPAGASTLDKTTINTNLTAGGALAAPFGGTGVNNVAFGQRLDTATFGVAAGSAISTPGYTLNFAADSLLNSFMGTAGVLSPTLKWMVGAFDNTGAIGTMQNRALSTSNDNVATSLQNNLGLGGFGTTLGYIQNNNAKAGMAFGVNTTNGSATSVKADGSPYFDTGMQANWGNNAAFNSLANVGSSAKFWFLGMSSNSPAHLATVQEFTKATWKLNTNGTLVYNVAAVPEADTWAMFAAGLLVVGAIARRRMQA